MLQVLIAAAIGAVILVVAWRVIRYLASAPPPDPDPDDAVEVAIDYRCTECGLRLTVTRARGDDPDPPRHCREDMEPA